jgi:hypothetical protein
METTIAGIVALSDFEFAIPGTDFWQVVTASRVFAGIRAGRALRALKRAQERCKIRSK